MSFTLWLTSSFWYDVELYSLPDASRKVWLEPGAPAPRYGKRWERERGRRVARLFAGATAATYASHSGNVSKQAIAWGMDSIG